MRLKQLAFFAIPLFLVAPASAQTAVNVTLVPGCEFAGSGERGDSCGGNQTVGVPQDGAPGFAYGSLKSNGVDKSEYNFVLEALVGRPVLMNEIARVSLYAKKLRTHAVEWRDWFLNLYTKRYAGQLGTSFYGMRFNAVLANSFGLADPANTWNLYSSDGATNRLNWAETTYGNFTPYGDLLAVQSGMSYSGSRGPSRPIGTEPVLFLSLQTGSGSETDGFDGQVDGLVVELTDGTVLKVNFEPFLVPLSLDACKSGGWQSLFRPDGSKFKNQGMCVSFAASGK